MTEQEEITAVLKSWSEELVSGLNVPELVVDVTAILDLASDAAHTVLRPAAPLSTFVAGYAAGVAVARGITPDEAVAQAIAVARELCQKRNG